MKNKTRARFAVLLAVVAVIATAFGPLYRAHAATRTTPDTTKCVYWTTNEGISAVAVTSGVNCDPHHSFTIARPPYNGATFANYKAFLEQSGSFVNGPGPMSKLNGVKRTLVGSAKDDFTNGVAVYVYQGPGLNDGSSAAFNFLIHGGYPWGMSRTTGPVTPATAR